MLLHKGFESIRTPELSKEDAQIQEIENEYPPLEEMYNTTIAELEASVTGNKYLGEFCQLWEALVKRQNLIITVGGILKEQQSTILSLNNDLTDKLRVTQTDQESIDRLKQEINNSLKMIDATHAREQVAQETIENLRQQIARLNTEMELKAKMEMDQDGEFATMTKNKELQQKEKEKVERELTSLKEKLRSVTADHDNLEEKYNATTTKLTELTQDIENKVNEIQKEVQLKLRLEDEVISLSKTLETKNTELLQTANELREALKKSRKNEQQVNREKAEKEQLKQDYSELNQRFLMFQEEFSAQARQFSEVGQKINIVGCEMKRKEEQIVQSKTENTKLQKIIETLKAKYERVTLKSKKLVTERDKIAFTIKMKEKEMQHLRKAVEHEKRNVQNALRQKEQEVKAKGAIEEKVLEMTRKFSNSEQLRQNLQIDIESHEKGIAKLKQMVRVLEKDKDRYIEEAKALTTKVEALMDEIRTKTAQIFSLKREILEGEAQFKQQQNLFDVIRTERNACAKELLEAQDEISEFKAKMKVMMHQVEQLKEDISCKESQLTREELAYRKLQSEKEAYRVEVQRWKDVVKENKRVVDSLREEVAEVKRAIDVSEARRYKLRKEMDSIMNERDILGSQLVRRNDEITLLYEKVRILQVTLDRGKSAYNLRIDEIRILKLEVENLRGEKSKLTKIVNNTTDFRTEIYHLERDLTKERLKSRALEEELQTPLNIHRWRKLGGSDPTKLELIQKIQILQKRLLKGITESQVQQKKLEESNKKYLALQEELSHQPGPDVVNRLSKTQHALKMKTKNSQCLMGQVAAYKSEIVDLNLSLQHLRNELLETKKLYFEQKKKCEKYKEQLDEFRKPKEENDMVDVIFPPIKQKLSNDMVNEGSNIINNQNKSIEKTIAVITRQSF